MGRIRALPYKVKVCVAAASSLIYGALVRSKPNQVQRAWCTTWYQATDCVNEEGLRRSRNVTDLKVVLPSYGQTGTSSVTEALRQFGLRAFHADDASVFAKLTFVDGVPADLWAHIVTRCRMDALSLEPLSDVLPIVIERSPEAKFILTWRPYPSWYKSTTGMGAKDKRLSSVLLPLTTSNNFWPWIETFDWMTHQLARARREGNPFFGNFSTIAYIYRVICNGYSWPAFQVTQRGTYKGNAGEEAYLAHINEIRTTVPRERLFEFDIRHHGWAELEEIVFGAKSSVSRGPFPQPRSKQLRTNEPLIENHKRSSGPAYFVFAVLHALNYYCIVLVLGILASW